MCRLSVFVHHLSFFWCLGKGVLCDWHFLGIYTIHAYIFVCQLTEMTSVVDSSEPKSNILTLNIRTTRPEKTVLTHIKLPRVGLHCFTFRCKTLDTLPGIRWTSLNHFSLEISKRVIGKQCRPRTDAAECLISVYAECIKNIFFLKNIIIIKANQIPCFWK